MIAFSLPNKNPLNLRTQASMSENLTRNEITSHITKTYKQHPNTKYAQIVFLAFPIDTSPPPAPHRVHFLPVYH